MEKNRERDESALGALTAEMANPRVVASAQEAMHPAEVQPRRIVLIHEEDFHGYACSWCGCRLPGTEARGALTLLETIRASREQRKKYFAEHVCRR
ncbi:MAG: hypothetical protein M3P45_13950 [Acidobacteriota bacterium]|nr:hypothetical protein [Acidobacteriota bacterium]